MAIQPTPSRSGQDQLAGESTALFLKVFSGEIVTTFEETNLMMPLHRVRTINSGKSAQFPVTGVASAKYHVAGESLLATGSTPGYGSTTTANSTAANMTVTYDGGTPKYGTKFAHSEKTIAIDDFLVASTFVPDIDQMMNHYDVRSIYSTEMGRALAYTADKNLIRTVISGARAATDRFGGTSANYLGSQITISADASVSYDELLAGIFSTAQKMDEKNVPIEGRVCILPPANYYKLVQGDGAKMAINKDWGGNGNYGKGTIIEVAGIKILKSNHIPNTNESTAVLPFQDAGIKNDVFGANGVGYGGPSFLLTQGLAFQTEGIGTVKLQDISVMTDYITERLGTLMLAKYAMGHGVLRNECCFEFLSTA